MNTEVSKVSIIGAGSWGTSVAVIIAENHPEVKVSLWAFEKEVVSSVNSRRINERFLPGVVLPDNIDCTGSLKDSAVGADMIIFATPSKVLVDILHRLRRFITRDMFVGFLTKGFCKIGGEIYTISQSIEKTVPRVKGKVVAISGPSHAEEVSKRYHTCLNVGSKNKKGRDIAAFLITCDYIQCRTTDDIVGVELGGTLKNPAAIAAGIIGVLPSCGDNLSGALISEALKEMINLSRIFKAREETVIDISGLGDLVTTALSPHSRNRRFGLDIGKHILSRGKSPDFIDRLILKFKPQFVIQKMSENLDYLVEGAYSIEPLIELAEKNSISIPVYRSLYEILLNKKDPSLLIETIKNPEKFDEIYSQTKIQIGTRKRGLEYTQGSVFGDIISERVVDSFTGSDSESQESVVGELKLFAENIVDDRKSRRELNLISKISAQNFKKTLKQLSSYYSKRVADRYNYFFSRIFLFGLRAAGFVGTLLTGNFFVTVNGNFSEISSLKDSTNIIYAAPFSNRYDFMAIIHSLDIKGMPLPRFYVSGSAVKGRLHRFILKSAGGFVVDETRLQNRVYRESVAKYLSTMIENGVPLLFFTGTEHGNEEKAGKDTDSARFYDILANTMFKHTIEIALVPVAVCKSPAGNNKSSIVDMTGRDYEINISDIHFLSEFTKRCKTAGELSETIKSAMTSGESQIVSNPA